MNHHILVCSEGVQKRQPKRELLSVKRNCVKDIWAKAGVGDGYHSVGGYLSGSIFYRGQLHMMDHIVVRARPDWYTNANTTSVLTAHPGAGAGDRGHMFTRSHNIAASYLSRVRLRIGSSLKARLAYGICILVLGIFMQLYTPLKVSVL
ncbi:hypothetical protein DFH29DRAFT_881207 [Suillus ampliporus]|nr:hypothetical protein DFH29DRAFT_881207 [Suillus ampliporus]